MKNNLTSIERMILESLSDYPKTLKEIVEDTGLNVVVAFNAINNLYFYKIIKTFNDTYSIDIVNLSKWKDTINNHSNVKMELKELVEGLVNNCLDNNKRKNTPMGLKKVWMDEKDEKTFQGLVKNLESFLSSLEQKPKKSFLKHKKIIMWAQAKYGDVASTLLV